MFSKDLFSVYLVTIYLFVYCILLQIETTTRYALIMLCVSPLLICWMVYKVIRHGKYNGPELGEDEFGYQDKVKDHLDVF